MVMEGNSKQEIISEFVLRFDENYFTAIMLTTSTWPHVFLLCRKRLFVIYSPLKAVLPTSVSALSLSFLVRVEWVATLILYRSIRNKDIGRRICIGGPKYCFLFFCSCLKESDV